jgi:arsenical pump membrane protein
MREAVAFSSLAVTVGLVLVRPRLWSTYRVGPAVAAALGVMVMLAAGLVGPADVSEAASGLWRSLLTVTAIMVLAGVAHRVGALDWAAHRLFPSARGSVSRLFTLVFVLSAATSAILNNDAAVLLLTPIVVLLVRRVYPDKPSMMTPFAFAVFMAAGVAPMVVSNPMNMIVADFAGIGFNAYAVRMLPVGVVGWVVSFTVLRLIFHRVLQGEASESMPPDSPPALTAAQRDVLALLLAVVAAYPVVSYFGGPIWAVSVAGALLALAICGGGITRRREILLAGVSWSTLAFLFGVFILAVGMRNAGVVDRLADLYRGAGLGMIGVASAVGSALINNHPMALINLLALESIGESARIPILAALIGGDLGPRLLPIGSLAGLLWYASLRRLGVEISMATFVRTGVAVTAPSLAVSLLILSLQ